MRSWKRLVLISMALVAIVLFAMQVREGYTSNDVGAAVAGTVAAVLLALTVAAALVHRREAA